MKGFVEVTPKSLLKLIVDCCEHIKNFDIAPYMKVERRLKLSKLRYEDVKVYSGLPHWYQYKDSLLDHFDNLTKSASRAYDNDDRIHLSELSYRNLVMLANGDKHANPIYIMNY